MHTNHRRPETRARRNRGRRRLDSLVWYRGQEARRRRRQLAQLMRRERYDMIPSRYPRDLLFFLS